MANLAADRKEANGSNDVVGVGLLWKCLPSEAQWRRHIIYSYAAVAAASAGCVLGPHLVEWRSPGGEVVEQMPRREDTLLLLYMAVERPCFSGPPLCLSISAKKEHQQSDTVLG